MALFYFIAKAKADTDWNEVYDGTKKINRKYVTLFPVSDQIGSSYNGLGITANGEFANSVKDVKTELVSLFKYFLNLGFRILDLYSAEEITLNNLSDTLNYYNV